MENLVLDCFQWGYISMHGEFHFISDLFLKDLKDHCPCKCLGNKRKPLKFQISKIYDYAK